MKNFGTTPCVIASPSTALRVDSAKQSISGSASFSDKKLFDLCQKYGKEARFWRQKFMGLLPEVNHRELWKKKGFGSIFEFAAKIGGLSEEQVRRVLNLEKRLDDKPILKNLLVNGEASAVKLLRVISVATSENEQFWADQMQILPQAAIETLIRDERANSQDLQNLKLIPEPVRTHGLEELKLAPDVMGKLLELQRRGIDLNQLLRGFLTKREQKIEQKKDEILEKMKAKAAEQKRVPTKAEKRLPEAEFSVGGLIEASRYIAVEIQRVLEEEYGTKCAVPTCQKPSQQIHHANRFALSKNHDPHFLAPLCREHHLIAHSIDLKFHEKRAAAIG